MVAFPGGWENGKLDEITSKEILRSVSLYYRTRCFTSSAHIYAQSPEGFRPSYTKVPTDAPMLSSSYKYNFGFWPKVVAEKVGNLVQYCEFCGLSHLHGLGAPGD
jgi:hypothetical protein